jgi:hypothetical protein
MDAGTTRRLANDFIDVEAALAHVYPEVRTSYDERDLIVYALGSARAPTSASCASPTKGTRRFSALPTYVVAPALSVALANELRGERSPGLNYGFERILHTAQHTELRRPLPRAATLRHRAKVKAVYDTRKYAVVVTEVRTYEEGAAAGERSWRSTSSPRRARRRRLRGEPAPAGEANLPRPGRRTRWSSSPRARTRRCCTASAATATRCTPTRPSPATSACQADPPRPVHLRLRRPPRAARDGRGRGGETCAASG